MPESALQGALERVDAIADIIRDGAAESEALGHLAPTVVAALERSELFRMLIARADGGLGLSVPDSVAVVERVASLDASTAWTLVILADGSMFARHLGDEAYDALCRTPGNRIAGSLNPVTARAERADGGFVYRGTAGYISGSAHAQWIMAAAIVTEDGQPVIADGGVEIRAGIFPIGRARGLDTWHVTGMRATGSNDWAFEDVFVATDWTFEPLVPKVSTAETFGAIPLWAQLGGGLASCAVGAARNMVDRFIELAATKVPAGGDFSRLADRSPAQVAVGEAQGLYQAARAVLVDTVDEVWARGEARVPFDDMALARQRLGIVTAVRLAARAIDLLHDAAGMNAVARDSVLDRCWRDVHTMTQHIILAPTRYEIAGRVFLGLEPGSPVI